MGEGKRLYGIKERGELGRGTEQGSPPSRSGSRRKLAPDCPFSGIRNVNSPQFQKTVKSAWKTTAKMTTLLLLRTRPVDLLRLQVVAAVEY